MIASIRWFTPAVSPIPLAARTGRLRSPRSLAAVCCAALLVAPMGAGAGQIDDGNYSCTMSFMTALGRMEIKDGRFVAVSRGAPESAPYPLEVSDTGEITLLGPLALLTRNGLEFTAGRMVKPGRSESGFMLTVRNMEGAYHTVFCG